MASTDKLMRARTRFKVINNVSTRFRLTQHSEISGIRHTLPIEGTFDIAVDITTYPGWKGELRAAFMGGSNPQNTYAEFFLVPWTGYDRTQLYNFELYISSCKLTYTASYTEKGNYYTADIRDQEIMPHPGYFYDDLRDLQQAIGGRVTPKPWILLFASGAPTVYQISQPGTTTELPAFKESLVYGHEKVVTPVGFWDGTRHDEGGVGSYASNYTMVSSVTFETLG